jgi:hypothetical protein
MGLPTITIPIPSNDTSPVNLKYLQPFEFSVSSACNLCFTKNPLFGPLSNGLFKPSANSVLGPYTAPNQDTSINFNTVAPAQQCTVAVDVPRTIHVSSTGHKGK